MADDLVARVRLIRSPGIGLVNLPPLPVDEIIRLSGAPSGAVQMALLELDIAGRLDRHAGGRVSLRPGS